MRWLLLALILLCGSTPAEASCPDQQIAAQVGIYDFTTVVLGAKNPAAVGVNGYYRMAVKAEGCTLKALVAKFGFTNNIFTRDRVQYGSFPARAYEFQADSPNSGLPLPAMLVDAELQSDSGKTLSVGFTFIGDHGFWRYVGPSWEETGMWGALVRKQVKSVDDKFTILSLPNCRGEVLGGAQPSGVAFNCGDLFIATPTLDRALWYLSADDDGDVYHYTGKILATGPKNAGWLEYCYKGRDQDGEFRRAARLQVKGGNIIESEASPGSEQKCGGRPTRPLEDSNRWQGSVGGVPTTDDGADVAEIIPYLERFCAGNLRESDFAALATGASNGSVTARALMTLFNAYGALYGYVFKAEKWLNDFYYTNGSWLPTSCRARIKSYASMKDVPFELGKQRDRIKGIWEQVK